MALSYLDEAAKKTAFDQTKENLPEQRLTLLQSCERLRPASQS